MPTLNINITSAWTKIADASNTDLLVSWNFPESVEIATTATDVAPTVNGHRLAPESAINRGIVGPGFVWARGMSGRPGGALVVTK